MPPTLFHPGDILLTRSESIIGGVIRKMTQSWGEPRTKANHVGLISTEGDLFHCHCIEATWKGVVEHNLASVYRDTPTLVAVYRSKMTPEECSQVVDAARSAVGRPYGYGRLVTHALDWFLGGPYLFRRIGSGENRPICSWVVAHAYSSIGLHFDVEPDAATPDDIADFCQTEPTHYERIRGWWRIR